MEEVMVTSRRLHDSVQSLTRSAPGGSLSVLNILNFHWQRAVSNMKEFLEDVVPSSSTPLTLEELGQQYAGVISATDSIATLSHTYRIRAARQADEATMHVGLFREAAQCFFWVSEGPRPPYQLIHHVIDATNVLAKQTLVLLTVQLDAPAHDVALHQQFTEAMQQHLEAMYAMVKSFYPNGLLWGTATMDNGHNGSDDIIPQYDEDENLTIVPNIIRNTNKEEVKESSGSVMAVTSSSLPHRSDHQRRRHPHSVSSLSSDDYDSLKSVVFVSDGIAGYRPLLSEVDGDAFIRVVEAAQAAEDSTLVALSKALQRVGEAHSSVLGALGDDYGRRRLRRSIEGSSWNSAVHPLNEAMEDLTTMVVDVLQDGAVRTDSNARIEARAVSAAAELFTWICADDPVAAIGESFADADYLLQKIIAREVISLQLNRTSSKASSLEAPRYPGGVIPWARELRSALQQFVCYVSRRCLNDTGSSSDTVPSPSIADTVTPDYKHHDDESTPFSTRV